ncbi:glycosyltransferase family 2 protein [Prevotella sp. E2-28]|uniref:glycosyltransferase family 2 protein n=1 Tax=Prevotella sp. E2-28 TaxID=2913620 RepID=UPI001EDC6AAC|nr:glycosyltransferase family 2 protein [Prevotella sp. E2-28]UKK52923.1 glycosyltransferase family 2 protein [Prevotella sp. E2-28]
MVELSIITVNYNGLHDTCALIETIPFNEFSLEMIVVDNASKEDEAAIISKRYPQVKAIRSEKNLGFAGGNNLGIKAAQGKYLFFINNDTVFNYNEPLSTANAFQSIIDRLESSKEIGMVCPKIRFAWDDNPIQFAGFTPLSRLTIRNHSIGFGEKDRGQHNTAHPTPYAHGAAMLVKREALEKVGMMPECYFLYYEELDWSMMFTRAGFTIFYEPACTIYHKESQSTGSCSPLKTYYLTRNRLLLSKRNIPMPQRLLTYSYLIGLVALRDICKYTIQQKRDLAKAVIRGVNDFLHNIQGPLPTNYI